MTSYEKNVETGLAVGKLAIGGLVLFFAWKIYQHFFGEEKVTRIDIPPDVGTIEPNAPDQPPPPAHAEPTGVQMGGLSAAVDAHITNPPQGGKVTRGIFRSTADVEIEVVNNTDEVQNVAVEIVADFHEFAGGERPGVRTLLTPFPLAPLQTTRFETPMDTGNTNGGLYEFGQANATIKVFVNNRLTQATYFEVW